MKKWLGLFLVLMASNCFAADDRPTSKEDLLRSFQEAINAKDEDAVMNLYYWEGVAEEGKASVRNTISALEQSDEAKNFEFKPQSNPNLAEYQKKGIRTLPNLRVLGVIEVSAKDQPNFGIGFPYGQKENSFYFTKYIDQELNGPQRRYLIVAGGNADVTAEGYCLCLQDGKETRIEFNGKWTMSLPFWAEAIKYCEVRRTSGDAPISLQILEGESEPKKEIFKSDLVSSDQPIIYKAQN